MLFCVNCGAEYHDDFRKKWGLHQEGDGLGPKPVCVALVKNESAPRAKDSSGFPVPGEAGIALQTCGGMLEWGDDEAAKGEIKPVTLIREGRRL